MQTETVLLSPEGLMVNFDYVRRQPDAEGNRPPGDLLSLEQLLTMGYTQFEVQTRPDDFSDDLYFRTEQAEAPYIIYTPKSQEMIDATNLSKTLANRKAAYLAESDPLMYDYLQDKIEKQVWLDKVAEIKARYPK